MAQSMETAMSWFLAYQEHLLKQQGNNESVLKNDSKDKDKKSKKRKKNDDDEADSDKRQSEGIGEEEILKSFVELSRDGKCQLANTLYDFEKTGLISLKKTDHKHITILKSIYTGINS